MATVLHIFTISGGTDASGNPVPLSAEFIGDHFMYVTINCAPYRILMRFVRVALPVISRVQ